MRPLVHVRVAQAELPASAAHDCSAWILERLPARRGVTLFASSHAPLPGATVTPWVLRGIEAALPALALPRRCLAVGDLDCAQRAFDGAGVPASVFAAHAELRSTPRLRISVPCSPRDAAIPRGWIGSNLVWAAPLAHHREGAVGYLGPASSCLAEFARLCRLEGSPRQLVGWGARLMREAFASASLVLDATWWAPLGGEGQPVDSAIPLEHCLASPSIASPEAAEILDAWIGQLLGHPPRRGARAQPTPRVMGERKAWPRTSLPGRSRRTRALAARAVEAVWSRGRRPARPALAPPTPGNFARVWVKEMR